MRRAVSATENVEMNLSGFVNIESFRHDKAG